MPCNPNNIPSDPSCIAQTLSINPTDGDLSISNGNTVNLASTIFDLQTVTQLSSFILNGNILAISIIAEDQTTQTKFVDLTPIIQSEQGLSVINTNSIGLNLAGDVLSANLKIDIASTLPISASSNGIKFNCCPETPITPNSTNTIQLVASGTNNYTLSANLKYQNSPSVNLASSSSGLIATLNYSTDTANAAVIGSDGAIYVQAAAAQLAALPNNGYVTTGSGGTLLVGSDSKLYRVAAPNAESPIIPIDTNSVTLTVTGASSHTLQADVNIVTSPTVALTTTSAGVRADVQIDTSTPGNVTISSDSNGLVANINETSIAGVQNTAATVQNPLVNVFGTLNNGNGGYAAISASQYGFKFPAFTTAQRVAIPGADLYDTMFLFDTTLRKFVWYDAVNITWVQIS